MARDLVPGKRREAARVLSIEGRFATEETWHRRALTPVSPQRDFLAVTVADEEYGVELRAIREIIKMRAPTEVPRAPAFVAGVISVRGLVVPVIDLRKRLRLLARDETAATRVLIVARDDEAFGLIVDAVRQVVRMTDDQIEGAPAVLSGGEADFVSGIGRPAPGRMMILLNLEPILRFEVAHRRGGAR